MKNVEWSHKKDAELTFRTVRKTVTKNVLTRQMKHIFWKLFCTTPYEQWNKLNKNVLYKFLFWQTHHANLKNLSCTYHNRCSLAHRILRAKSTESWIKNRTEKEIWKKKNRVPRNFWLRITWCDQVTWKAQVSYLEAVVSVVVFNSQYVVVYGEEITMCCHKVR